MLSSIIANLPRPPTREEKEASKADGQTLNPIKIVTSLNAKQWLYFFVGWAAWTMDAYDFFGVSLTLTRLETYFGRSAHTITTSITLTLLFRSVGAFIFGFISDRYGRRWPLCLNLIVLAALELGTGYVKTFHQFLAVRSLFGLFMGGVWGAAVSTALECAPAHTRGFLSGVVQQGYAIGYLIAAGVNLTLVPQYDDWRVLFYLGAGLSLFIAILRAIIPESDVFVRAREHAKANPDPEGRSAWALYMQSAKLALKLHWLRFIYACLLMTGFNFLSHGSQDLYPTYAQTSKGMTSHQATVLTIIGNVGAVVGGTLAGYVSQYLGRRLSIIGMVIWVGCFIPLWIIPSSFSGLAAGAFFIQFGVQGAWGVIPIYLSELSPPAFRAMFAGLSYQIGNMVSSASAQIEATAGDQHQTIVNGVQVPDYAFVQGVLIGVVAAYILILIALGREYRGRHFESEKMAIEQGGGLDDVHLPGQTPEPKPAADADSAVEQGDMKEKEHIGHLETA